MITSEEALHLAKKYHDSSNEQNGIYVTTPPFSSLPQTFYSQYLTTDHKLMGIGIELSVPSAGDTDWSVAFANGSLTISGTFHGSTATTASMSIYVPKRTITLSSS